MESRHQNSHSEEQDHSRISQQLQQRDQGQNNNKLAARPPGRPRGRGRPKLSQKVINNRKKLSEQDQDIQAQVATKPRQREKINAAHKQENNIQGYVKIVDYLKKIDCDEVSFQNKMNPFHCLTANCFWYMVSAEYFSYDFYIRNNPKQAAYNVLNRVAKLPLQMPTRFIKNTHQEQKLQFQTQQIKTLSKNFTNQLDHLIPQTMVNLLKTQNYQKKMSLTSVTEDNQFISSLRATLFNYVKDKIANSQKWKNSLETKLQDIGELQPSQFERRHKIVFQEPKEDIIDASALDILSKQAKKNKPPKVKGKGNGKRGRAKKVTVIQGQNEPKECSNQQEKKQQINNGVENVNNDQQKEEEEDEQIQEQQSSNQKSQSKNQQKSHLSIEQEKQDIDSSQFQAIFTKKNTSDEVLLSAIINLPIDKAISILEATIPKIDLPEIEQNFMPIPKSDPLDFVFQLHEEEQKYMDYMKQYQKRMYEFKINKSENIIEQEERQGQFEDAKCQICTDGDYTDDNLIVFCSMCNISLHQRCVGLAKVPAESWICQVCQAFGPSGINLPCPLCDVKGGALKRTHIHIDTNVFKETNPNYYEYSKRCLYNKQKQEYIPLKQSIPADEGKSEKMQGEPQPQQQKKQLIRHRSAGRQSDQQEKQQLYYDYFNKSTYPANQPTPLCHYVWVHYVCSIWIPECYFEQKNGAINIKGIQHIDKRRFKHECFICKKIKNGACVKCDQSDCKKYYHPECARKKKVYMEQLNLEKIKYLIFCQAHQPLKITRQIQYKKKKSRDQIIKFARMIEKYVQTYKIAYFPYKLPKITPTKSFIQTFEQVQPKQQQIQKKPQVIKQTDQDFIKEIIIKLSKAKKITATIQKTATGFKVIQVHQPSRRQMRKCLNKYDDFWHTLQNGESAQENCRRYDHIIKENFFLKDKLEIFLNGGSLNTPKLPVVVQQPKPKRGRARGRAPKLPVETLIEQEGGIFCICRKPYENQTDMLQCQICGQWYHYKCIGFVGTEQQAQTIQFHCMKCMKFQTQEEKRPRLQKCIHYFRPDSVYLNYSPPTPKLVSQEDPNELKDEKFQLQQMKPQKPTYNIINSIKAVADEEKPLQNKSITLKVSKKQSKSSSKNEKTSSSIKQKNEKTIQIKNSELSNGPSSNLQSTITNFFLDKKIAESKAKKQQLQRQERKYPSRQGSQPANCNRIKLGRQKSNQNSTLEKNKQPKQEDEDKLSRQQKMALLEKSVQQGEFRR